MNCKKCGAVLSPNSTICSMCGCEVSEGQVIPESNIENDVLNINQSQIIEISNNQENSQVVKTEQAPIQNIDDNIQNVNNVKISFKKNNDTLFYLIIGILSFLIVGAVIYLLFFANK